jgi:glucosamine 6-phosphate synthetase-like amidotransferase/phosphosugar isomerase protein
MCGLVGIVGDNLTQSNYEAFKWMLTFDTTRGEDSTGVAFRKVNNKTKKGSVTLLKTEGLPYKLYQKFPEVFSEKGIFKNTTLETHKVNFLMGHNRAATIGLVNSLNAHPFHHEHITGCHNGTVRSGLLLLEKGPEIKGSTDSEQIFYTLAKGKSLKEVVSIITGGTALTWWDGKAQTYNLYRNSERPLHYVVDPTLKTVYYASEAWILRAAFSNSKLTALSQHIVELEADTHLVIQFKDGLITNTSKQEVKPTPPPKPKVVQTFVKPKTPDFLKNKGKSETPFRFQSGWIDLPNLSKEEFNHNARFGCAMCSTSLEFEDYTSGKVTWMSKEAPFCHHCASEFDVA